MNYLFVSIGEGRSMVGSAVHPADLLNICYVGQDINIFVGGFGDASSFPLSNIKIFIING